MAKKKTAAKKKVKTSKKVQAKKAVKKKVAKKKAEKTRFDHLMSAQSGFIDLDLVAGKSVKAIEAHWNKQHPDKPMKPGRVVGHIKHLVADHGFDKKKAEMLLGK